MGSAGDVQVSDYSKGKRLRKLLRLLNSKQALQAITSFKLSMVALSIGLTIIHLGCFVLLMVFINQQDGYVKEIDAAGGGRARATTHDCHVMPVRSHVHQAAFVAW